MTIGKCPVMEIGCHPVPDLTGHRIPTYHIHEYSRDNLTDRNLRLLTPDEIEKVCSIPNSKGIVQYLLLRFYE